MPGRGAPPGAVAVGRPTKVPCGPVSGRIWVAHFVWENRPVHGPPHTKRPPRQRPPDPGATEPATGGRRWSESICGSEDGRGPLPPRRGLESTPTQLGHHPSAPLAARKGAYPPGYRREPSTDGGSLWPLGIHPSSPLPVRRTLGRVLILRGNRREPSSDWAAWISGARFFFFPARPAVSL